LRTFLITIVLFSSAFFNANAQMLQGGIKEVVQFSGIIRVEVSGAPIPFSAVYTEVDVRGTIATLDGFFSFVVAKGDWVIIKSLGYKSVRVRVPENTPGLSYYRDIELPRETYTLDSITIYPLPQPHQLRQAMLNLDVPDNMVELAKKTIAKSKLEDLQFATRYDGMENYNAYVRAQVQTYYSYGQPRPIKLFDAFSWAQFIKAIKDGDFKKKGDPTEY
jgi:hypothetical protein